MDNNHSCLVLLHEEPPHVFVSEHLFCKAFPDSEPISSSNLPFSSRRIFPPAMLQAQGNISDLMIPFPDLPVLYSATVTEQRTTCQHVLPQATVSFLQP